MVTDKPRGFRAAQCLGTGKDKRSGGKEGERGEREGRQAKGRSSGLVLCFVRVSWGVLLAVGGW